MISTIAAATAPGAPVIEKHFFGGTHRVRSPADTIERVTPLFPAMGITRVADVTGLDRIGIPVVVVCRPNSRSLSVSQGKGTTLDAAAASGIMESIESWHAERVELPLLCGSYDDLRRGRRLARVSELPRTSYGGFHAHLPLLWIEGFDLLEREPVWVPFELVHTNYTLPRPTGAGCFLASSNGLASGNHLLEAVVHAVSEVVERDGTTLFGLSGQSEKLARSVDLQTVDDDRCRAVLDRYSASGIAVAVWDTTTNVGVPSFSCVISEDEQNPFRLLPSAGGMGCHPVREIALLRALTEAAQSRATIIAGSRDDLLREDYERVRSPDVLDSQRSLVRLAGDGRRFADVDNHQHATFNDDLSFQLDGLRAAGASEVVAFDLSRPGFPVSVARVVIAGLEAPSEMPGWQPGVRARALTGSHNE
ncbi:MAG: YcaO-like family protein [Actinomycetota bacterium]|jgi:YcaO-like protein with predicted kinase domain|nr:YcaO-like family protein [Actinomycetota bacterium]